MSHFRTGSDGHTIYHVADDGVHRLIAVAMEEVDAARIVRVTNAPLATEAYATRVEQAWHSDRATLKRIRAELKALIEHPQAADMAGTQWVSELSAVLNDSIDS